MPQNAPYVSKSRSKRGIASHKKLARQKNLLLELEAEIEKWLTLISTAVTLEAIKTFSQIPNSGEMACGVSLGKHVLTNTATEHAAETLGKFASYQALEKLFRHTRIPSLLTAKSRKHKNRTTAQSPRPAAKALYRKKIEELLSKNIDLDCKTVLALLERHDWIIETDTGNWKVATSEMDGRPNNSVPYKDIRNSTMEEAVSTIKNKLRKKPNH
ncbi:hypothetical protein SAMN05660652_02442 [Propionivibrio dicarboxylicus]|uniref:Uncharacterized protein n=2 Tax=Propionivibrio dicarboxylicus TaxID=83767 RepID=A0A1G8FVJ6_9RHOO|nr:hypothetical protein SAMN05660652_02442 [Propionivibrio dicarboxylicus]